ncbi:hypothetical protein GYMLUDRAFT_246356 [Collybiopsis luxurians FD-317 M1]|uniref:Uncharacterized protein n=1 Tax=Collybiopsis luxurians FD-317 M1 TaxID=944289 RepID=A0A0D0C766_9AGAR|nr:hypothetical protein GYMLUDRAFT_246356 [Collybiopsis luxurians FD-317 M1]
MAAEAEWRSVSPTQPRIPPFSVFAKPIQKSPQDDREYRGIKLENGLEAVLIHDGKADKAAASLDVAVGHLADPDDMLGMAHFCEHLSFMGTQQFPKENKYSEPKTTGHPMRLLLPQTPIITLVSPRLNYPGHWLASQAFFILRYSPLHNDSRRIYQLSKHLSKPGHVWRKFGTGNRETLSQAAKDLEAQGKLPLENKHGLAASILSANPSAIPTSMTSPALSDSSTSSETEADTEEQWTLDEYLKELPTISVEDVNQHANKILASAKLRLLVMGNTPKAEAIKIAKMSEAGLVASSASSSDLNERALVLPEGCNLIKTGTIPNPNQVNSALTYYVRIGSVADRRRRVVGALLSQILSEPAFSVLRTKEQLGYIVSCGYWSLPGAPESDWSFPSATERGIRTVVQSERTPGFLESRVEAFLNEMKTTIETMTPAIFQEHKTGLGKKWTEDDKNLKKEVLRYLDHINSGHLDFYRDAIDAETLKDVTKEEVHALFMSHVCPSSKTRSKLSVQMRSEKVKPKRISAAAAGAFEAQVRELGVDVAPGSWRKVLSDDTPAVEEFKKYWREELAGKGEGAQRVLESITKLVQEYPVPGEGQDAVQSGATYIGDMKKFRARLKPAEDLGAMIEWGDLPASKF